MDVGGGGAVRKEGDGYCSTPTTNPNRFQVIALLITHQTLCYFVKT